MIDLDKNTDNWHINIHMISEFHDYGREHTRIVMASGQEYILNERYDDFVKWIETALSIGIRFTRGGK